jgi:hypothetical protein
MRFLLADTFTGALARLPAQEAKAVKTTVVDLQIDPTGKGLSYHRIGQSKDPNFWCVRVSRDLRLIVHKTEDSLLVAYVDHHDKAYAWAENLPNGNPAPGPKFDYKLRWFERLTRPTPKLCCRAARRPFWPVTST